MAGGSFNLEEYLIFPEDQVDPDLPRSSTIDQSGCTFKPQLLHTQTSSTSSIDLSGSMLATARGEPGYPLAAPSSGFYPFLGHTVSFDRLASTSGPLGSYSGVLIDDTFPPQQAFDEESISSSTVATFHPASPYTYIPPSVLTPSPAADLHPSPIYVPQFIQPPSAASPAVIDPYWNASTDATSWSRVKGSSRLSLDLHPPLEHSDNPTLQHIPISIDEVIAANRHLDPRYEVQKVTLHTLPSPSPSPVYISPPRFFQPHGSVHGEFIEREYSPWVYPSIPSPPVPPKFAHVEVDNQERFIETLISCRPVTTVAWEYHDYWPSRMASSGNTLEVDIEEQDEQAETVSVKSPPTPIAQVTDAELGDASHQLGVTVEAEVGGVDLLLAQAKPNKFSLDYMSEQAKLEIELWMNYRDKRARPRVFPKTLSSASCVTTVSDFHQDDHFTHLDQSVSSETSVTRATTPPRTAQPTRDSALKKTANFSALVGVSKGPKKNMWLSSAAPGFLENIHVEIDAILYNNTDAPTSEKRYAPRKMRHDEKVFHMVASGTYSAYIDWNQDGDAIVIPDISAFETHVMPVYFTSNDFKSFLRQCTNMCMKREKCGNGFSLRQEMLLKSNRFLFEYINRLKVDTNWTISGLSARRRVRFVQSSPSLRRGRTINSGSVTSSTDTDDGDNGSPAIENKIIRKIADDSSSGTKIVKKVRSAPALRRIA